MFYHIKGLHPIHEMGGFGFAIQLWPETVNLVEKSGLTQEKVDGAIENMGQDWLDCCGYGAKGQRGTPLYSPRSHIRISWGEWGIHHITVPGNACGLDIEKGIFSPRGGKTLSPHNVDNWSQVHLLLVVFTWFADCIILFSGEKRRSTTSQLHPAENDQSS